MGLGKILVIRGGAIGDFILTLPVLAALRRHLPRAGLEVLGYPHIAQLALAGGLVDAVRPIEAGPLAGFFAREGKLDAGWRTYFAGFAVIVSYLYDPDAVFRENVARCTTGDFIAGPHRPDETTGLHATRALLKPLERLAIFDADPVPRLQVRRSPGTATAGGLCSGASSPSGGRQTPRLAVHPGSGSERKNWPEARWVELLLQLARDTDWSFLLVGGEAEGARLERLAGLLPASRLEVARSLPLTELAERLAGCAAFVGHDSGITHLAAALGLRTLALWGDSEEAVWRPLGDHVRVLREAGGLAALGVGRVADAVAALRT